MKKTLYMLLALALVGMGCGNAESANLLVVRLEAPSDAAPDQYERVEFYGTEYKFARQIAINLCDVDRVAVRDYVSTPAWSVLLMLKERAAQLLAQTRNRQTFALFFDGELLYAGGLVPWQWDDRLEIGAADESEARQLAERLNAILPRLRSECADFEPREAVPIEVLKIPPSAPETMEEAALLSSPAPQCSAEAIRSRLSGTVLVHVTFRKNGSIDTEGWRILKGSADVFEGDLRRHVTRNWRVRPARRRGQPVDTVQVLEIAYNCSRQPSPG